MSKMMKEFRNEPRLDRSVSVQVAGDPEKKNYAERSKKGMPLKSVEYEAFKKVGEEYGVRFE
jgi:LDH2 family malate/lactate/ureidoglycolate dehydrogenase